MKEKIKHIFIGALIGVVALPTISLGGAFVFSLIQGKTVEEAVQILVAQIDSLIGRIEILEGKQSQNELWQEKEDICNKAGDYVSKNMSVGYINWLGTIAHREEHIIWLEGNLTQPDCQGDPERWGDYEGNQPVCVTIEDKETIRQGLKTNLRPELERLRSVKEEYELLKQECDDLTSQYDELYGTSE